MDLQLNGRRALVTGSTAGIGLAIAARLAAEGAETIVNGRTQQRVDDAVAAIRRDAPNAKLTGIAADLSTAAGVQQLLRQLPEVDILVNNMGIFEPKPFVDIPDADWQKMFEANVLSGVVRDERRGAARGRRGRAVDLLIVPAPRDRADELNHEATKRTKHNSTWNALGVAWASRPSEFQ